MEKLHVIRGQRILNQLNETAFTQLKQNTLKFAPPSEKRQHVMNSVQVQKMEFIPSTNNKTLQINADIVNEGSKYQTVLLFRDVEFHDSDESNNVTFIASTGDEYHITPIGLNTNNVLVRCNCLDFRWRFAIYNDKDNSLYGPAPGPYNRTSNRPPVNPQRVPGVCKHLLKTAVALQQSGVVT